MTAETLVHGAHAIAHTDGSALFRSQTFDERVVRQQTEQRECLALFLAGNGADHCALSGLGVIRTDTTESRLGKTFLLADAGAAGITIAHGPR